MPIPTPDEVFDAMIIEHLWELGPKKISREKIEWAMQITGSLSGDPLWGVGHAVHKCPLCGYETTVTNICRNCPQAPIISGWKYGYTGSQLCEKHGIPHWRFDENGKLVWLMHATVGMYVMRNKDGSPVSPEIWMSEQEMFDDSIIDPAILKRKEEAYDDSISEGYHLRAEIIKRLRKKKLIAQDAM